jgi:hypothetical protein
MAKHKSPGKPQRRTSRSANPPNPGLPDPKTVISERTLVSPKGARYRILRTTEKDPYDSEPNGEADKS